MARVSVIIPVFNAARTVGRAVESVLAQEFDDVEIIVVDDGSTDESKKVLATYDNRLKLLEQKNRGPSAARNLAARVSQADYLGFLDADDWWAPGMLARMVPVLEADPRCVMAYCDLEIVDSTGRPLETSLVGVRSTDPPTLDDMLHNIWPIMPSGVVMRRRALEAAGGWPEELTAFEDVYLWLLMRELGHFAYVPERLAVWRFSLFPDPLKRGGGQERAGRVFRRMVRERYGIDPAQHVAARRRAPRSILGYIGLNAMASGDHALARRAFFRALQFDRFRIKNHLRLMRTFLPHAVARKLSGRTRKASP